MGRAAMAQPKYIWVDGKLTSWTEANVHITAVGWSSMAAVFEGIKAYWNADEQQLYAYQFAEHYRRFAASIRVTRMELNFSVDALVEASLELLRANECHEDTQIRPVAFHGNTDWFGSLLDKPTVVVVSTAPVPSRLGSGKTIKALVSSWTRLSDNMMPPRVKCISNYENSRLALIEAQQRGADLPILLNGQGKVTEGPSSCLFIVRNGVAITPSLTSGILESITRDSLLRLCREALDIPVAEREIDRSELYLADEIFFCGTGAEVTPVGEIDGYVVGDGGVGPITARIERLYHDVVRGREPRYAQWRVPVYGSDAGLRAEDGRTPTGVGTRLR
ncbi:MAG: branched-chain amino acid transaminase [Chloroflexi bacterium]|nr:branched-chain amino acid transaminase [Chloroflexota bacterium]